MQKNLEASPSNKEMNKSEKQQQLPPQQANDFEDAVNQMHNDKGKEDVNKAEDNVIIKDENKADGMKGKTKFM